MVNLKLEQTLTEFYNALYLSKFDLSGVYNKTFLGEESILITYFANHENTFQYKRLMHDTKMCLKVNRKSMT